MSWTRTHRFLSPPLFRFAYAASVRLIGSTKARPQHGHPKPTRLLDILTTSGSYSSCILLTSRPSVLTLTSRERLQPEIDTTVGRLPVELQEKIIEYLVWDTLEDWTAASKARTLGKSPGRAMLHGQSGTKSELNRAHTLTCSAYNRISKAAYQVVSRSVYRSICAQGNPGGPLNCKQMTKLVDVLEDNPALAHHVMKLLVSRKRTHHAARPGLPL